MKSNNPYLVLEEISDEHVPQDVNVLPDVLAKIQNGNMKSMKTKRKTSLTILTLMAALIIALPGTVFGMRAMLGFIPGIGLVEQSESLRTLAEPVSNTRDGFTLTVENAVLDSEHTLITYSVEGPFEGGAVQSDGSLSDVCYDAAELRLPDGTVYQVPGGFPDETWTTGYRVQYSYPALPATVDQATLFLTCLHAMPAGQGPENWDMPLAFVPGTSKLTVYPLDSQTELPAESETVGANAGINLAVDSVIPLPDGQQLVQIRLDWRNRPEISGVSVDSKSVSIFDANGQAVAFEPSSEATDPNREDLLSAVYGFKTAPIEAGAPARFVIEGGVQVNYITSDYAAPFASFTFDPTSNPQADQIWELNQDLQIDGRQLRILSVAVTEKEGNASLSVEMTSSDGIVSAAVVDPQRLPVSGGGSENNPASDSVQPFWSSLNYDGGLPEGPITVAIVGYSIRISGPMSVEWTPAAVDSAASALTAQPQAACLSESDWQAAQTGSVSIPDELNGKVLYEAYDTEASANPLSLARLDGSQNQLLIEDGSNASISPDGKRVVYTDAQGGLFIYDLSTGVSEPIPGASSNSGIVQPFWSPDGKQIGFTGTPDGSSPNLYLTNLDGANPRLLANGEALKLMQGWMPDGRILYVTMDENGPVLKLIDPQSGETQTLFNVPQLTTPVAVVSDGDRLAINWLDEASGKQTLYVFSADGSQRKALLELNAEATVRSMHWSPDGNWLLIDLAWTAGGENTQALVKVDTCQIVPVTHLEGKVLDWLP
ncbi:periplasmic component of the Tol biopolymer transport system [Longilinea arvoryzae]|uniref:Periplasmic component of the Tol biopolymer transport system n=1 Tax=Longilinea arvoryzae TaxID=360412 RepID=A0A0S7BBT0_9CHLR|nr:PD40 domain-containing protein [Longilinea arvoryzae]GAP12717.1 periplasmic component of the Tol biopolymer transport system [Longilinea arvoryzae]